MSGIPHLAYSINGLAEATSLSRREIYNEAKRGNLVLTKLGNRTVILLSDAQEWLRRRGRPQKSVLPSAPASPVEPVNP